MTGKACPKGKNDTPLKGIKETHEPLMAGMSKKPHLDHYCFLLADLSFGVSTPETLPASCRSPAFTKLSFSDEPFDGRSPPPDRRIIMLISNLSILAYYATLLPFGASFSTLEDVKTHNNSISNHIHNKVMSPKRVSEITLHGVISWVAMGLLVPLGVLTIRMSHRKEGGKAKVLLYFHVIFEKMLAALLATAGAIMSMKSFENSFDNNHQRIGLALYGAIWVQTVLGFLRPTRGNRRRSTWYFVHWILGTIVSLAGIINIYTGLNAYHRKVSRSTRLWTVIFTAQISFMGFFYLFQDKWAYMQKQGVLVSTDEDVVGDDLGAITPTTTSNQVVMGPIDHENQKRLVLVTSQPCGKRNALKNLFD